MTRFLLALGLAAVLLSCTSKEDLHRGCLELYAETGEPRFQTMTDCRDARKEWDRKQSESHQQAMKAMEANHRERLAAEAQASAREKRRAEIAAHLPECLKERIARTLPQRPAASFEAYESGAAVVFSSGGVPACCDQMKEYFDSECKHFCSTGGITGRGDGKCKDALVSLGEVWRDPRPVPEETPGPGDADVEDEGTQ